MTVSSLITKIIYQGNGVAKTFAVPFQVLDAGHLFCRVVVDGVERDVSNYTVAGIGTGAVTVTYPSSGAVMPVGQQLVIYRLVPLIQNVDLVEYGAFYAETHEYKFDYLTMIDQQLQEKLDRAIVVDISEGSPPTAQEFYAEIKQFSDIAAESADRAENAAERADSLLVAIESTGDYQLNLINQTANKHLTAIQEQGGHYVDQAEGAADRAENAAANIEGFADNSHVFFGFKIDDKFNLIITKSQEGDYIATEDYDAYAIWPVQVRPYLENGNLLLELPFQPPYGG